MGGRVEFGGRTIDAIEREVTAEVSAGVSDRRPLGETTPFAPFGFWLCADSEVVAAAP